MDVKLLDLNLYGQCFCIQVASNQYQATNRGSKAFLPYYRQGLMDMIADFDA